MKHKLFAVLGAACLALASAGSWAQEDDLKGFPGYVDFGQLGAVFGEPTIEISVGKGLLGLVGALSAQEDPELAELFSRLEGVRVRVFETEFMADGAVDLVKDVSANLATSGWESVVTVNSEDEQVRIFMKMNDANVEGVTVMAVEQSEAVFVNVIGLIDPAELSKVMDHFDVELHKNDEQ